MTSLNIYKCLFTYILMLLPIYMASVKIKGTFEWKNIKVVKIVLVPTKVEYITDPDPRNPGSLLKTEKHVPDWHSSDKVETKVNKVETEENKDKGKEGKEDGNPTSDSLVGQSQQSDAMQKATEAGASVPPKAIHELENKGSKMLAVPSKSLKPVPTTPDETYGTYEIDVKENLQYRWAVKLDGKLYPLEERRQVALRGGGKKTISQPVNSTFKEDEIFNITITHHEGQNSPYVKPQGAINPSRYATNEPNVTPQQMIELARSQVNKNEIIVVMTSPSAPKPKPIGEAERLRPDKTTAQASMRPSTPKVTPQEPESQGLSPGPPQPVNKHIQKVKEMSPGLKARAGLFSGANSAATSAAVDEAKPLVSRSKITAAAEMFNRGSAATNAASEEQPIKDEVIIAYGVFTPDVTDYKPPTKHQVNTTGLQRPVQRA